MQVLVGVEVHTLQAWALLPLQACLQLLPCLVLLLRVLLLSLRVQRPLW